MGRLKAKRSTGHSFVKYVETEVNEVHGAGKSHCSSPLERRASASPSKTQYSTPYLRIINRCRMMIPEHRREHESDIR